MATNNTVPLIVGGLAAVLIVYLIYESTRNKPVSMLATNQKHFAAVGQGSASKPLAMVSSPDGQQGYDSMYYGPQPVDLAYEEYDQNDMSNAPLNTYRSNEYLSQANPELAAWDSSHLLPNATLSNCEDGMITDGPSFNQLSVFSGNKLFEASQAERYFLEQQPVKLISLDIRPLPAIASSSLTAVPWYQSSLGIQDTLGGLTHVNQALCSYNSYPSHQPEVPVHGGTTSVPGMPAQSAV